MFICAQAVGRLQLAYFEENFYDCYLEMCTDRVPQVRMEFARSLLHLKPYLEPSKNKSLLLSERIDKLKMDKDRDVADATESVDYELLLTRKKILKELEVKEVEGGAWQKKLDAREARETEEKKKRMEEDEENKYEYGIPSHTNRAGLAQKKVTKVSKTKVPSNKTEKKSVSGGTAASGLSEKTPTKRKVQVAKR